MHLLIKGFVLGLVIIIPGMSGGTLLLLLGLYEKMMRDLARLKILPWLPFIFGTAGGVLISGVAFSRLLEAYAPFVTAFLLGCILASLRAVLGADYRPNFRRVILFVGGAVIGFLMASEPMSMVGESVRPGIWQLLIGGALACTTMILPGVPGSSVLIIMGIYDNMLMALAGLDWLALFVFALGALLGVLVLSNILDKIYTRYRASISWLFSGLILGSARMLIPTDLSRPIILLTIAVMGFALVWQWGKK